MMNGSVLTSGCNDTVEILRNISYSVNCLLNSSNNSVSYDEVNYLKQYLGERYLDTSYLALLTFIYVVIFMTGTIGNVCTCIVIARNRNMHTATNYYLFSLAVSDLCTLLLALPPELYGIWEAYPWIFGTGFCIMKSFISEATSYASVLTITAFTIERYAAICHPLRFQRLSSLSRAVKVIINIWIIASICALPYPLHARTFHAVHHPVTLQPLASSLVCNIPFQWHERMTYVFQVSTFMFFVLPMVIITVMYVLIGVTLYRSEVVGDQKNTTKVSTWTSSKNHDIKNGSNRVPYNATTARKAVLKMLVAVVIAFFACWAPFHSQRLMTIYVKQEQWTKQLHKIQTGLFYISGALYFFSATVNPILYNIMSRKYQQAFKRTICRCSRTNDHDMNTSFFGSSNSPNREKATNYNYSRISAITKTEKSNYMREQETVAADISV